MIFNKVDKTKLINLMKKYKNIKKIIIKNKSLVNSFGFIIDMFISMKS